MNLYFDSSVYSFIETSKEARAVRSWLNASGHRVEASDEANLGEALRTPDPAERASRIKTIMTVAPTPTYPSDLWCAEEFLREVRLLRPGWIRTYPSLKSKDDFLRHRRAHLWNALKRDPTLLPGEARRVFPILHQVFGDNAKAQKARRTAQLQKARRQYAVHVPDLVPVFAAYSELEQYARYQAEAEWRLLLTEPTTASAEMDWLMPHLDGQAMSRGNEWATFWIKEARLQSMPMVHLGTLVEYFQAERPVKPSNTVDRIHAQYLITHDRLLTADADFYDVLVLVAQELKPRGSPVLIKRSAGGSALAELRKAV